MEPNQQKEPYSVGFHRDLSLGLCFFCFTSITYHQQPICLPFYSQLSGNNPVDLFLKANIELQRAADWFSTNKLTLNVKKTKFILFRPKNKKVDFSTLNLKIGNEKIERIGNGCKETCFKFVGIRLDEFLTWDNQISHVSAKLSSANYTIARTKNVLPINIRKNLYNSLFRSHMEYGILSWGNALPGKLKKIKNIQKKCSWL